MTSSSSPTKFVSAVAAVGYGAVQTWRAKAYEWGMLTSHQAPIPVVSVGNLLMGGSGKTPFVIRLAELLSGRNVLSGRSTSCAADGKPQFPSKDRPPSLHRTCESEAEAEKTARRPYKVAVVSRGYHGTNRAPYLVVGDGASAAPLVPPSVSGDEPFLIARSLPHVPVLVGAKRFHPVLAAARLFGCHVVILDDGFQHLPLHRHADIVLLTGREDRMFPLGWLREPFSALSRADVAVLVGPTAKLPREAAAYLGDVPVFRCRHAPVGLETAHGMQGLEEIAGRDVVLVSGIGHPDRFRCTAEDLGWRVRDHVIFPDHHVPTDRQLDQVLSQALEAAVVVTEKDWVKLPERFRRSGRISSLKISMVVEREEEFLRLLEELLFGARPKRGAAYRRQQTG